MLLGKTALAISFIAFISYGLISLISPAIPAGFAGLTMNNGDAFAEIGAMYGGLQTGCGLFCALALFKPEFYRSGLMLLILGIGGVALARFTALMMVQDPVTSYTYGALAFEIVIATAALIALLKK